MKTKKEILKMSKEELSNYKWSDELDNIRRYFDCSYCYDCFNYFYCAYCTYCSNCFYCSYCYDLVNGLYCRNLKFKKRNSQKFWICNVEVTKKEFDKKKKELGI